MPFREFAVPLALLLIALLVYLLLLGRLSAGWFVAGFIGVGILIAVVAVILPRSAEVSEVGAKAGSQGIELMVKMEKIREDIYAKAEAVQRLAEYVGRIAAFAVTKIGRFAPENLDALLLQERDELVQMLNTAGIPADRVADITASITRLVAHDLAVDAAQAAWQTMTRNAPGQPLDGGKEVTEIVNRLIGSSPGQAVAVLQPYLQGRRAWDDEVHRRVSEFDEFRKTGRLPSRATGTPAATGGLGGRLQ